MLILAYDGTFPDLVKVMAPSLRNGETPQAIESARVAQPSLFAAALPDRDVHAPRKLIPDPEDIRAARVPDIPLDSWRKAWFAFLADQPVNEMAIFRYLQLVKSMGKRADDYLTEPNVACVQKSHRHTAVEAHRFKGLLRFQHISDNLYYAVMHPECNILPILCPFFADRLADQNWIISDPRRSLAGVFNTTHWRIIEDRELQLPAVSAAEAVTQKLWRAFFDSIAVKERLNPKSQRGRMPKKYWRDLVEEPQT